MMALLIKGCWRESSPNTEHSPWGSRLNASSWLLKIWEESSLAVPGEPTLF